MLTVDEVLQIIAREVLPGPPFSGDLSATGGVLAQDVKLDEDSPPFDRAQLDGYAVRSADATQGARLALAGQVDAGGQVFSGVVQPGTCVGINTGGVVPPGADAILMVEHAQILESPGDPTGITQILVQQTVKPGYGIQRRGSDARAGQVVLPAGTRLGPAQVGVCAAAGIAHPMVRSNFVRVLSTGDELLPIDTPAPLPPGKIRNSNQVMLCALARTAGARVEDMGTCPDEPDRMRAALTLGLQADLLVVCGGMSMGTRDLVPLLLKALGVQMKVEKVRIKPGKPFVLGVLEKPDRRHYIAGLPGNPVSAFVTFQRFVRPMLRQLEGAAQTFPTLRARIDRALPENADREFYVPCILRNAPAGPMAELLTWKGSADLFTLAQATGLLIQPAGHRGAPAQTEMDVLTW